jgi:uncharacterized protein
MNPLVVGFDLDMTLVDTRAGIAAVWAALSAETGVHVDGTVAASRLGPPLEEELALWFPPEQVAPMGDRFREIYPLVAIDAAVALPGAVEAIRAVHDAGGKVVVVTAKYEPNARLHLDHLELPVDDVVGWRYGEAKGVALRERLASIYVGDHVGDILGAHAAGAVSVAVATGPIPAEELRAAGASVVLRDLREFPEWLDGHLSKQADSELLESRLAALEQQLRALGSVAIAFSGGADSAFLLAAAVQSLGPANVLAVTAVSNSLPDAELAAARQFAAALGVQHLTPATAEMERPGYRANAGDRCYFCKAELLDVLVPLAQVHGLAHVATGTNADDAVAGFRPGIKAAHDRGARTPLRDCGLTKAQIREASRRWGLPTWDKPAAACLSSRIAYGIEITPHRLARVEEAEAALRLVLAVSGISVGDLRVRDLGAEARVEIDAAHVAQLLADPALLHAALESVRAAGFEAAVVDPKGFRSGSMNELLDDPVRYQ